MSTLGVREGTARAARYEDGFRVLQGKREYVTYPDNSSIRICFRTFRGGSRPTTIPPWRLC